MKRIICAILCVALLFSNAQCAAAEPYEQIATATYGGCAMVDQYGHYATEDYTFLNFDVAGVTFQNGRRRRQTILRQIYWKDEPYQKVENIRYVDTEWEGEPAIEVWVESELQKELNVGKKTERGTTYETDFMACHFAYFNHRNSFRRCIICV